jgi:hypothetical protein
VRAHTRWHPPPCACCRRHWCDLPTLWASVSSSAPGGEQQSVATPQAARGWARPPCRHFKNQSCCCVGSASHHPQVNLKSSTVVCVSLSQRSAVVTVYSAVLSLDVPVELRPPLPASEKGVLQMLFDVRFLLDVLAAEDDAAAPPTVRERLLRSSCVSIFTKIVTPRLGVAELDSTHSCVGCWVRLGCRG